MIDREGRCDDSDEARGDIVETDTQGTQRTADDRFAVSRVRFRSLRAASLR